MLLNVRIILIRSRLDFIWNVHLPGSVEMYIRRPSNHFVSHLKFTVELALHCVPILHLVGDKWKKSRASADVESFLIRCGRTAKFTTDAPREYHICMLQFFLALIYLLRRDEHTRHLKTPLVWKTRKAYLHCWYIQNL